MGFISWIILGAISGVIAKLVMPGDDPGGFIITILLGIAGALVGGFIASALGFGAVGGLSLGSIVIAVLGAVLLLFIYRLFIADERRRPELDNGRTTGNGAHRIAQRVLTCEQGMYAA